VGCQGVGLHPNLLWVSADVVSEFLYHKNEAESQSEHK